MSEPIAAVADPLNKFIFYSDGTGIAVFSIDSVTGVPTEVSGSPFPNGLYAHQVVLTPPGTFLYVVGEDSTGSLTGISAYCVDRNTGFLTAIPAGTFTNSGGSLPSGPSIDIAVSPDGKFLYFAENDGIHAFTIDPSTGGLTPISNGPVVALSYPIQVTINPSGTVLYVGVGGNGTIAAYSINSSTGALTEVAGSPYQIYPNPAPAIVTVTFVLDPLGKFLYLLNGASSGANPCPGDYCIPYEVEEFRADATTGALLSGGTTIFPWVPNGLGLGPQLIGAEKLP